MSWNYRVVRTKYPSGVIRYGIHEAHYNRRGRKNPRTWSEEAMKAECHLHPVFDVMSEDEGVSGLRWVLEHMLEALDKPVVDGNKYDKKERTST